MFRVGMKGSQKPENELCPQYRRRLQRLQDIARREREEWRDSQRLGRDREEENVLVSLEEQGNIQFERTVPPSPCNSNATNALFHGQEAHQSHAPTHTVPPPIFDAQDGPLDLNEQDEPVEYNNADEPNEENIAESNRVTDFQKFSDDLRRTFVTTKMSHQQINGVLQVLRTHNCFANLPKDSRTILETPRSHSALLDISGGEYLHIGLKESLTSILRCASTHMIPDHLQLDFNTDGATLDAQGKVQMWPIQIKIANINPSHPEVVGVWKGSSKPNNYDFLEPFIDELLEILNSETRGIFHEGREYSIGIRCFIADAPARAGVLAHAYHNAYNPCSKCWVRGNSIRQGVMAFVRVDHRPRTNEEYINRVDGEHHSDVDSHLLRLPMNLVEQVPFEYMHSVCLGVVKKIFSVIVTGKYAKHLMISAQSMKFLNDRLSLVKSHCPNNFARKAEDMNRFSSFKATELRQILLYSGPVIFRGLVDPVVFEHFLILHTAIRLLVNPRVSPADIACAKGLLRIFVQRAETIYGIEFMTYNIHCLLHLADDVTIHGPLDSFSACPFESNMSFFRESCRKPYLQLQQIANRRIERNRARVHTQITRNNSAITPGKPWESMLPPNVPLNCCQYRSLKWSVFSVSLNNRDDTLMLEDDTICVIQNIIFAGGEYALLVKKFQRADVVYDIPCPSQVPRLLLYSLLSDEIIFISLSQVRGKCFRKPYWYDSLPDIIPDVCVVGFLSSSIQEEQF